MLALAAARPPVPEDEDEEEVEAVLERARMQGPLRPPREDHLILERLPTRLNEGTCWGEGDGVGWVRTGL